MRSPRRSGAIVPAESTDTGSTDTSSRVPGTPTRRPPRARQKLMRAHCHPNSRLPEFGTSNRPEVGYIRLRLGRGQLRNLAERSGEEFVKRPDGPDIVFEGQSVPD